MEAPQEFVQQDHLAAGHDQAVDGVAVLLPSSVVVIRALEQEGVVAALLELCDDVQKAHLAPRPRALYIQLISSFFSAGVCSRSTSMSALRPIDIF